MITATSVTTLDFLRQYYLPRHPNCGAKSAEQIAVALRLLDEFRGCATSVEELTDDLVRDYMAWLQESGRAARTVNGKRDAVLGQWRFCWKLWRKRKIEQCRCEPPPDSDDVPKLAEPKRLPVAWTLDEMKRLLQQCERAPALPRFGPKVWLPRHWSALVRVIWDTGFRLDTVLESRRDWIDHSGHMVAPAEHTKSGRETARELSPKTLAELAGLPQTDLLFPWPFSRRQIWIRFEKDLLIAGGLPYDRRRKFHCLRRTSASHLAKEVDEWAAMKHLDHTSIDITRKSYIDPRIAYADQSAARVLPEI